MPRSAPVVPGTLTNALAIIDQALAERPDLDVRALLADIEANRVAWSSIRDDIRILRARADGSAE